MKKEIKTNLLLSAATKLLERYEDIYEIRDVEVPRFKEDPSFVSLMGLFSPSNQSEGNKLYWNFLPAREKDARKFAERILEMHREKKDISFCLRTESVSREEYELVLRRIGYYKTLTQGYDKSADDGEIETPGEDFVVDFVSRNGRIGLRRY